MINKVWKHINILERHQRAERRREKYEELERKYKIKKKRRTVIEELKQQLHAETAKLKRYEARVNQYKIVCPKSETSLSTDEWYKKYQ